MSNYGHEIARQMDAERERVQRLATRPIARITRRMRQGVLEAFRQGGDIDQAIEQHAADLADLIIDAAVVSHLHGRRRIMLIAEARRKRDETQLEAYDAALALLRARLFLDDQDVSVLRTTYRPEMTQAVGEATAAVRRRVGMAVLDVTERGLAVDAGMAVLQRELDAAGIGAEPWQVETLFRTQTQIAYAAGRDNANQDPAIDEILWGYEYVAVQDDRTRPEHLALDGMKAAKNDPIWDTHKPPNGFNCRCQIVPVFRGEQEAQPKQPPPRVTIDGIEVEPGVDSGWSFDPLQLHRDTLSRATVAR